MTVLDEAAAAGRANASSDVVLSVRDLRKTYPITRGLLRRRTVGMLEAVAGVSFEVRRGETLGLVGESGCGKSTTARCVLRLVRPDGGQIRYAPVGEEPIDVLAARGRRLRQLQQQIQIVFQDPYASLSPRMTVEEIVGEPFTVHRAVARGERRRRVGELLETVGLAREHARRYPHEFSGGQRQRIAIARALALDPSLLVLDEPVSSLDVSIQAQVLNLLQDLQQQLGLSYLFIAHDLAIVRHISHTVAVMHLGEIVEQAPRDALYERPLHPYTRALLAAVRVPEPAVERRRRPVRLRRETISPAARPPGCRFHPRCPIARVPGLCNEHEPPFSELEPAHLAACHFAGEPV